MCRFYLWFTVGFGLPGCRVTPRGSRRDRSAPDGGMWSRAVSLVFVWRVDVLMFMCICGKCYRPAIDQIVDYKEKY